MHPLVVLAVLNLLLVRLDLALELVDQGLHPLVVLAVLVLLVAQLLDLALGLAHVLLGISHAPVLSIQLRLELTDAGVHLGHRLLAALQGLRLGLIDAGLDVLDLGLQELALPLKALSKVLLTAELISQPGGVDHGTLGLLVAEGLVGVGKLLLNHTSGTVGLLQQSAGLLQGVLVGVALAVGNDQGVVGLLLGHLLALELGLGLPQTELVGLDVPLGLGVGSVGVLQVALEIQDISLQLLLHPQSLGLALGLSLDSGLHVLQALAHVLLGGGKLLLLLSNPALDLLPHLGKLELSTQHLVLLLLESSLSLAESSLQLHLLGLKALADFVNLVDGASTLADLVHDVLDLVGEVLVLPPDLVKLEHSLLVSRLHPEQLGGGVAGLLLGRVKVHANGIDLALPFADNPVELLGLLLHGQVEDLSLVKGLSLSLEVRGKLSASLVKLSKLGLQLVSGGIGLGQTSLHLQLGHLELLGLGDSLLLVPHTQHVSLSEGLVQGTSKVLLGADLLLVVVLHAGDLVLGVPELAEKGLPLLGLVVSNSPGLVQLVGEGELQLGEHVGRVLHLLQLAEEVRVLGSDLPLGSLHVVEGEGGLLDLLALIIEGAQEVPVRLLRSSLGPVDLVDGSTGIGDLAHDEGLVLLNLVLHLVELLNLLGHLSNGVLVFLLEAEEGGLLLDVGLLEIAAQLGHLSLTLLVQLDLGGGGSRGLSE